MRHDRGVLGPWMAFTLFIGAARADANPDQIKSLRANVLPAIADLKRRDLTPEETRRVLVVVLTRVQTIMGHDWQPQGEWMVAINSMLERKE